MQLCQFARATRNICCWLVLSSRLATAVSYVSCTIAIFKENSLLKSFVNPPLHEASQGAQLLSPTVSPLYPVPTEIKLLC